MDVSFRVIEDDVRKRRASIGQKNVLDGLLSPYLAQIPAQRTSLPPISRQSRTDAETKGDRTPSPGARSALEPDTQRDTPFVRQSRRLSCRSADYGLASSVLFPSAGRMSPLSGRSSYSPIPATDMIQLVLPALDVTPKHAPVPSFADVHVDRIGLRMAREALQEWPRSKS